MARVLYKGQTLDVPDSDTQALDYYRGEGAQVDLDVDPNGLDVPRFPLIFDGVEYVEGSPEAAERDAWVSSATVAEVLDAVDAGDASAAEALAAEQRRGDVARTTLLDALQHRLEAYPADGAAEVNGAATVDQD